MERIKSIDIFRGASICWMIITHLQRGWLGDAYWDVIVATWAILDVIGVCGFLFISGVSTSISYKKRMLKANTSSDYTEKTIKYEYLFRALIILIMALSVNLVLAIVNNNIQWIFAWQFLLTLSFALFLGWPFLKTSKSLRIIFGAVIWIINQVILYFLIPCMNQANIGGFLYYILYTTPEMDSILTFFTFFLIGSVVGEVLFETLMIENKTERIRALDKKLIFPSLMIGVFLVVFGISFDFPEFLNGLYRSFPWMIYSSGIHLILISTLLFIEEHEVLKTKREYRFLFYFSYYSFTVYASHYLLTLIFWRQLNDRNIWIFIIITLLLYNLLFRLAYKTLKQKISLKAQINVASVKLTRIIEERKKD